VGCGRTRAGRTAAVGMRRRTTPPRDFGDDRLPEIARRRSPERQAVAACLDDERVLAPLVARCPSERGRQTIPLETYRRRMFLKRREPLEDEALVADGTDRVGGRRWGRISRRGRGLDGVTTWVGWGAIAPNLAKCGQMQAPRA
jgi:hypothetical protein